MGGMGPVRKEERSRKRDNPQVETIVDDGVAFGPDLPEGILPNGEEWHPQTLAWWRPFDGTRSFATSRISVGSS